MINKKYFKGRDRYGTYGFKMGLIVIGRFNGKYEIASDSFLDIPRSSVTFYKSEKKPKIKDLFLLNLLLILPTVLWLSAFSIITLLLFLVVYSLSPFWVAMHEIDNYDIDKIPSILSLVFCFLMFVVGVYNTVSYWL